MTLREHTFAIRNLLSHGPSSDDFSYSNRLIAHFLQVARARLLEQKADKYHYISEQSYQDLCIELELTTFHKCCEEVELACGLDTESTILRSVDTVPKFLNSRWGNFLKVLDRAGRVIPEYDLTQSRYSHYALSAPVTGWFLHNNHLFIVNNKVLRKVILSALFDDPNMVHQINCPTSGTDCTDFQSEEFPIDSDLIDPMYRLTLEFLTNSAQRPIDFEANSKDISVNLGHE